MKPVFPRLVGALLLAACGNTDGPVTPTLDQPPNLRAFQFTDNVVFPLDLSVFVSCAAGGAGELVQLTGSLHSFFT